MKVLIFTEGTRVTPASRIRVYEYLDRFKDKESLIPRVISYTSDGYCRRVMSGWRISLLFEIVEKFYHLWSLVRLILGCLDCEVVFIQRVLLPVWFQRMIARLNSNLVYDFDDAVYLGKGKNERRFAMQVGLSRRVLSVSRTTADQARARGANKDKVMVLYSPVDCSSYNNQKVRKSQTFTVGWIGSLSTSFYLEAIWNKLASFGFAHPEVRFMFIGARKFDTGGLKKRTNFVPWSPQAESELLCKMDVGLMPLDDDNWSRGKGGYKLIQYMAGGVAALASPVGANLEILLEGETGMFAYREEDWIRCLEILLADRELCYKMGRAGRRRAEELFDYKVTAPVFFATLRAAAGK